MVTWDEIKAEVEGGGGTTTVSMEKLRDAHGADRLGINVRSQISSTLAGIGLAHVPQELPNNQDELVRIYKRGTPVGDFIDTALKPGLQNDAKLAARFSDRTPDYAALVSKIRELVAE